ncbi:unnamed protein product [Ranitomeya imitator]|uniref:Galectin n=1 Tax=Ranitomeya imitator TaxID=111125 RepID=A0ABN9LPU2_9NEOB|nr:unnamed protein product [Ranitomeya imitator]
MSTCGQTDKGGKVEDLGIIECGKVPTSPMSCSPKRSSKSFEASCPQGLCPGWSIIIKGETSSTENDFEINFLSDSGDQIAFHFNPRFPEGSIICNSFLSSHWGHEERTDTFPMEANEPFQIEIFSDRENFQVFVDDSKVIQYRHRMKQFSAITKVQVLNDINISSVEISRREMY